MGRPHKTYKLFNKFKGLDTTSSDYERSAYHSSFMQNLMLNEQGSLIKRPGIIAIERSGSASPAANESTTGYGLITYINTNSTTGAISEELISISTRGIYKADPSDETLTAFALLDRKDYIGSATYSSNKDKGYVSRVYDSSTSSDQNTIFTYPSMVQLRNCIYITGASGKGLLKYDGNILSKASLVSTWDVGETDPNYSEVGLPSTPSPGNAGNMLFKADTGHTLGTIAGNGATLKDGSGAWRYLFRLAHKDAKGNYHEGVPSSQHLGDESGIHRLMTNVTLASTGFSSSKSPIPFNIDTDSATGTSRGSFEIGGEEGVMYTLQCKVNDAAYTPVYPIDPTASLPNNICCEIKVGDTIFAYNQSDLAIGFCEEGVGGHTTVALCDAGAAFHSDGAVGHFTKIAREYKVTNKVDGGLLKDSGIDVDDSSDNAATEYGSNTTFCNENTWKFFKVTVEPVEEGDPEWRWHSTTTTPLIRRFSVSHMTSSVEAPSNWISASNHRLLIYRTKNIYLPNIGVKEYIGDPTYYLVEEIALPTNTYDIPKFGSTSVSKVNFHDRFTDSGLSAAPIFLVPDRTPGSPPKDCKLSTSYHDHLLLAGNPESANTVYYSDYDSPENFPLLNSFNVDNPITALATLGQNVYIFQEDKIHYMSGTLSNDNFRVVKIADGPGVGTTAPNAVTEINGTLFFINKNGVFSISPENNIIKEVSELVGTEFKDLFDTEKTFAGNAKYLKAPLRVSTFETPGNTGFDQMYENIECVQHLALSTNSPGTPNNILRTGDEFDDVVHYSGVGEFDNTGDWAFSFWFKLRQYNVLNRGVIFTTMEGSIYNTSNYGTGWKNGLMLSIYQGQVYIDMASTGGMPHGGVGVGFNAADHVSWSMGGGNGEWASGDEIFDTLTDYKWHHIVITNTGTAVDHDFGIGGQNSDFKVYIDAVQQYTTETASKTGCNYGGAEDTCTGGTGGATHDICVAGGGTWIEGNRGYFGSDYYGNYGLDAAYNCISLWKKNMSAAEIVTQYNNGIPLGVDSDSGSDCRRFWKCSEYWADATVSEITASTGIIYGRANGYNAVLNAKTHAYNVGTGLTTLSLGWSDVPFYGTYPDAIPNGIMQIKSLGTGYPDDDDSIAFELKESNSYRPFLQSEIPLVPNFIDNNNSRPAWSISLWIKIEKFPCGIYSSVGRPRDPSRYAGGVLSGGGSDVYGNSGTGSLGDENDGSRRIIFTTSKAHDADGKWINYQYGSLGNAPDGPHSDELKLYMLNIGLTLFLEYDQSSDEWDIAIEYQAQRPHVPTNEGLLHGNRRMIRSKKSDIEASLLDGDWHHMVLTSAEGATHEGADKPMGADNWRFYIDGIKISSDGDTIGPTGDWDDDVVLETPSIYGPSTLTFGGHSNHDTRILRNFTGGLPAGELGYYTDDGDAPYPAHKPTGSSVAPLSTFNGDFNFDEISVWSTELSAADVTALYNSGEPSYVISGGQLISEHENCTAWWRFGDSASDSLFSTTSEITDFSPVSTGVHKLIPYHWDADNNKIQGWKNDLIAVNEDGDQLSSIELTATDSQSIENTTSTTYTADSSDFTKCTSFNWKEKQLYLLYIPKLNLLNSTGNLYTDGANLGLLDNLEDRKSLFFAYDYSKGAWLNWTQIRARAGLTYFNKKVYGGYVNTLDDSILFNLDQDKLGDNDLVPGGALNSIPIKYATHWEAMGDPTSFKKFLRFKIFTDDSKDLVDSMTLNIRQQKDYTGLPSTTTKDIATVVNFNIPDALNSKATKLKADRIKACRLILEHDSATEAFNMKGYEIEMTQNYRTGEMKE